MIERKDGEERKGGRKEGREKRKRHRKYGEDRLAGCNRRMEREMGGRGKKGKWRGKKGKRSRKVRGMGMTEEGLVQRGGIE